MQQMDQVQTSSASRRAVRDFLYHLMVFVFVNALLIIVDVRAGTGSNAILGLDWAFWITLFWGMGLVGHAVDAFYGDHTTDI